MIEFILAAEKKTQLESYRVKLFERSEKFKTMAQNRRSFDGRKRTRTMEYIDNQVDINDDEPTESQSRDLSKSMINRRNSLSEFPFESLFPSVSKVKKRDSEPPVMARPSLPRHISDINLTSLAIKDSNKPTTELKGRDHIARLMKNNRNKSAMDLKNHRFLQEMIARRQEKQQTTRSIGDFALKYGLLDNQGKKIKSRQTSEQMVEMGQQLETLQPILTKRQAIDPKSPLLRIVKLESVCNHLLCYCQYVTDREDLILFLDPHNEQVKNLVINDEIRIAGDSRLNMNLPELGSVTLGITDVRKDSVTTNEPHEKPMEIVHQYDFHCSCCECSNGTSTTTKFDLRSTFPGDQLENPVYDSFTLALMTQRKFDLRGTIITYQIDSSHHQYLFLIRDGIGNCLQITFDHIDGLTIEIQSKVYIFHQIEYVERIPSPANVHRWPFQQYPAPTKLFCFRSTANQVTAV